MSFGTELADVIRDDWTEIPALAGVRVIATERELDEIDVPTALLRVKSVGRSPAAPLSHRNVDVLVTLISPHLDADRATEELDVLLDAALDYFDTRYKHDDAAAVGYSDRLAFDIPISVMAAKSAPESE